ncbi:MmgE/PrpD family protein [Chloroflexota bacterium]
MTLQRDLAWENFDMISRKSIAYQFARYALRLNYEMLPPDVVHQAKRCLLDALGCAIGAYEAPGRPMCEDVVKELGGLEEATVFGSGLRTSAHNATLVNSFLVRFLDYNDMGGGRHGSDAIAGILAVSEREKASGRDFLTSLVISYELGERACGSLAGEYRAKCGWDFDLMAVLNMPPTLGRLMRLNEEQIANAIGICAFGNFALGIQDSDEEMVMRKSLRFGWGACAAILSCMLAKKGFTGPVRVVEGQDGMNQVLFQGRLDLERMTDFEGWRILLVRHKYLCGVTRIQATGGATLDIVKEHDLKPEDIAAVHIKLLRAPRLSVPFRYPRCAESADHSVLYLTAIAIKERSVGPNSIQSEKFTDPIILDLMEKITVESDSSLSEKPDTSSIEKGQDGKVEIVTKDGRKFQKHIVTPHGLGDDPLTDEELEDKFRDMAAKYMDEEQIRKIFDAVWNVEKLNDINKLTRLMVFKSR